MDTIRYEQKNHVALVTLNRPNALNAFNYEMLDTLGQVVEAIRLNPDIRVVIFTGAGDKAFSVGADLKERKNLTDQQVRRNLFKIGEVFKAIERLPQPTIAQINGYAFGGGLELALACDFRIAASSAIIGLTETSLGIIPGAGGTQRLPRLIGEAKALELILTARKLNATEASAYGILTKVIEPENLKDEITAFTNALLANAPIAIRQAKFAVQQGMNVNLEAGLAIEQQAYELTIPTEDREEALLAFTEKRMPIFKGK